MSAIAVTSGIAGTGYDFGELRPATISGNVFEETNGSPSPTGQPGISAVTVTLAGTDDLGNPPPGTYTVTETQPTGVFDGRDAVGSASGIAGNDTTSGISLVSGMSLPAIYSVSCRRHRSATGSGRTSTATVCRTAASLASPGSPSP